MPPPAAPPPGDDDLQPVADGASTPENDAGADPILVPSRRQYLELKAEHPGALLLYRLGDFYETFDDDAKILARDARVTLTSRSFGRSGRVPMAGIPHHALTGYLGRLLAHGHTVAIAEQVGPVGKGLVRREVARVFSPGTVADPSLLPPGESRYLAAVARRGERIGCSWVDVSTGEWSVVEWAGEDAVSRMGEELARVAPAETLLPDGPDLDGVPWLAAVPGHQARIEGWLANPERAGAALCGHFGVASLDAFGCEGLPAAIGAAGMILAYLERTDRGLLGLLAGLRTQSPEGRVGLDAATRRNLELTRSFGTGGSRGSLLGVLDTTRTPMGARALRRLLGEPLRDVPTIRRRQRLIAGLVASPEVRARLGRALAGAGDLERLAGRVARAHAAPRDLLALLQALRQVEPARAALAEVADEHTEVEVAHEVALDPCAETVALLESSVVEDEEVGARIRAGFELELDAAIAAVSETRAWLTGLEARERERTGIRSLKVGYTKVFGYFIEVTRPNLDAVPADYTRKQTVAGGERYVTAPLKDAEATLAAADEEIALLERAAVERACASVGAGIAAIQRTAAGLAHLDGLLSLAEAAARWGWTAPEVTDGDGLLIRGGRHPVVEAALGGEPFIPNDLALGGGAPRQLVVTGPNMGGKSTFLRQTGLIVLLAQVGSFVPAAEARVGAVDRIFTRVGAHDDLARGQSTFMVEMVETAAILHGATRSSLLLLDEIGRGTSTLDGVAIARATLEDIAGRIGARCLFATHYLELAGIAGEQPSVGNAHVSVLEREGRVVFLYAVRPGPADRAYGVQVARLAGLPPWVADRAARLLAEWEAAPGPAASVAEADPPPYARPPPPDPDRGPALDPAAESARDLADRLRVLDLDGMTARQALAWLWAERDRLDWTGPDDRGDGG